MMTRSSSAGQAPVWGKSAFFAAKKKLEFFFDNIVLDLDRALTPIKFEASSQKHLFAHGKHAEAQRARTQLQKREGREKDYKNA
jgi:hypothetical protein